MREDQLHPTPEWGGILRRELRRTVVSGKGIRLLASIAGAIATSGLIAYISSWIAGSWVAYAFLGIAGILWPIAIWGKETWGKRDHWWSLPVDPASHDVARVVMGWLTLMAAALFLVAVAGLIDLQSGYSTRAYFLTRPNFWIGVVLLPTVVYFIVSAVWLSSRQPWYWLAAPYFISTFARRDIEQISDLPPALSLVVEPFVVFLSSPVSLYPPDSWIWANLVALLFSTLCMLIALRRYGGNSR